jgi:hypothetical protein
MRCGYPCPYGHVAEWLRSGLQNRLPRFNSGRGLQHLAQRQQANVNIKSTAGMSIEVPLSALPISPPQLEGQHVLEGGDAIRHLFGLLACLGRYEWDFRQALALFDSCRGKPSPPPSAPIDFKNLPPPPPYPIIEQEGNTLWGWSLIAARDGAFAIYHFGQALGAIPPALRKCPTLSARVDHSALRLARKSFKAAFTGHEAIRHVVGHTVDFNATIEERERHSIKQPWRRTFRNNLTIEMIGPRPMFSPGDLVDRVYKVTYDSDVHCYEVTGESLDGLSAIRESVYGAFNAVTDLDYYTCVFCGSRDLKEIFGRRVYQCNRCDRNVADELMIRAKYRRLRTDAATAPVLSSAATTRR